MKYENGFLMLEKTEQQALSLATFSDKIEARYEAREFINNMLENQRWAKAEIERMQQSNDSTERGEIITGTLRLCLNIFEQYQAQGIEATKWAGISVQLH